MSHRALAADAGHAPTASRLASWFQSPYTGTLAGDPHIFAVQHMDPREAARCKRLSEEAWLSNRMQHRARLLGELWLVDRQIALTREALLRTARADVTESSVPRDASAAHEFRPPG